jgi:hypothetical protein
VLVGLLVFTFSKRNLVIPISELSTEGKCLSISKQVFIQHFPVYRVLTLPLKKSVSFFQQRFLPRVGTPDSDPIWTLREYGHSGNWTEENARFCLETAIAAVVWLQSSPAYRSPLRFHDVFDDVVIIVAPDAHVLWAKGSLFGFDVPERELKIFQPGDVITGHARGRPGLPSFTSASEQTDIDLEWAEWIELTFAKTERRGLPAIGRMDHHILWLKKDQVQIRPTDFSCCSASPTLLKVTPQSSCDSEAHVSRISCFAIALVVEPPPP